MNTLTIKERIYLLHLNRKVLAARLSMSYSSFSHRLCGFTRFSAEQERSLLRILDDAEATQAERGQEKKTVYRG